MSISVAASITSQMKMAYNAVTKSVSDDQISSALISHGFNKSMLEQGETLYEAATLAVGSEIVAEEMMQEKEKQIELSQKNVRDSYFLFTETASKCFGKDALEMLGLKKTKPRTNQAYCDSLKASLLKLKCHPELAARLEKNGFGTEQIDTATKYVETFLMESEELKNIKNCLESATKKRNTALFTQKNWLSSFAEAVVEISEDYPNILDSLEIDKKELFALAQIERKKTKKLVNA